MRKSFNYHKKYQPMRYSTKGGAVLLNFIKREPISKTEGGAVGSNKIVGIIAPPPMTPSNNYKKQMTYIPHQDLLSKISFGKSVKSSSKPISNTNRDSNIKFVF